MNLNTNTWLLVVRHMKKKLMPIGAIVILLIAFGALLTRSWLWAQSAWTTPAVLFKTEGWTFHLASTIDLQGRLITAWQFNPYKKYGADAQLSDNNNDSLFVSRLKEGMWSTPSEVLLGRIASERATLAVTPDGILHLFSQSACLWYSRVPAEEIERSQNWSSPVCLADGAYAWPAVTVSEDGRINLLYAAADSSSFYLITSDNSGVSWSAPQFVLTSSNLLRGLTSPAMAEGPDGVLHLVWVEVPLPETYPAAAINYARSLDRGATWSAPLQLAGPRQADPTVVADSLSRVHVAWNGDAGDHGRYYASSTDQGATWGVVETILQGSGGLQLPPALAVDDTGVIHGLFADQERLVYMQRVSDVWSPQQVLIGTDVDREAKGISEIDSVRLHILNGNELHALYTRFGFGEVLHQMREIDAPRKTPIPLLTPEVFITESSVPSVITSENLPTPALTSTVSPVSPGVTWDATQPGSSQQSSMQPLIISTALAALLVGTAVLTAVSRRR